MTTAIENSTVVSPDNVVPGASRAASPPSIRGALDSNFSLRNSRASWNEVGVNFTIGEYRIVELLISKPGHYFTYRAIYDCLRHEGFIAGEGPRGYWANVRSAIKRIRKKFRAVDAGFEEIQNCAAVGYRWRHAE
jgi:two-component system response regulator ChvI